MKVIAPASSEGTPNAGSRPYPRASAQSAAPVAAAGKISRSESDDSTRMERLVNQRRAFSAFCSSGRSSLG
ncbi:hypothetical protein D3C86_1912670 [compost metagenome]